VTHPPILVFGYSEAAMLLRRPNAANIGAALSIHGKREFPVEAQTPHRLVLCFDDEDVPDPADPLSAYRSYLRLKWAKENGLELKPPTIDDARSIIEFAGAIRHIDGTVLFQCAAGMSRSTAAALLCLSVWTGKAQEQYCVEELFRVCRGAVPHRGLVRFGDTLLGREGKLSKALGLAWQRDL
jgi:predicted protein tyrosine phosphatase